MLTKQQLAAVLASKNKEKNLGMLKTDGSLLIKPPTPPHAPEPPELPEMVHAPKIESPKMPDEDDQRIHPRFPRLKSLFKPIM